MRSGENGKRNTISVERPVQSPPDDSEALTGRRITLGVTGSIAAYKAADLASQLVKLGADVRVILTAAASEFVGAATFRALTLNPVLTSVFDEPFDRKIAHIELAQSADLILIAPATADVIAKMAHGIADDLLTSTLLAASSPIIVAPAMNTAMLSHPATQENIAILRNRGVEIIEPAYGVLACRTEGEGKLADLDEIVRVVVERMGEKADYRGIRVTVTAGPTREPLDPVRFISNRSSGKMGYALARAAAQRGARVTLISGPVSVPPPAGVEIINVNTTREMLAACQKVFSESDLFIAAAAPADYRAEQALARKRKKAEGSWTLTLSETEDILAALSANNARHVLVGFAAETEALLENAAEKLRRKKLDLIVANDVTAEGAGFESDTNVVTLLWPDGRRESLSKRSKQEVAARILDAARPLIPIPRK
jgi:phosphopantothenoylcysteine decarboxylase/phosphopantothenate--cysteine ligase